MKNILSIILVSCFVGLAVGEGDSIPSSMLRGVSADQVKYSPAGNNQWKKIPKGAPTGKHFEICPLCKGSGQLNYYIKGRYVGIYDCVNCGPGHTNSPDGLVIVHGEDFSDCYFPEMIVEDVELSMSEASNTIEGDINLVSDNGKKISRGHLMLIAGFQDGYINAINFDWDYLGNHGEDRKILNYQSNKSIFRIIDDDQMTLDIHIIKYTPKEVTVRLVQRQKELFPENKQSQEKLKSDSDDHADSDSNDSKDINSAQES